MDKLRTVILAPYHKQAGPKFVLTTFDTGRTDALGKSIIAYEFREQGKMNNIFAGDDFHCSPLHAIDSDECVYGLLGFLTLRPGDVEVWYFKDYTASQHVFVQQHAEHVAHEIERRFGRKE